MPASNNVSSVTISNGASLSNAIDLANARLIGLETPATFEPTTLSFQASQDGVTYANLYDSFGNEYTITCSTSRRIIMPPADFYGLRYLKVRGGTSGTPTTVAADRVIKTSAAGY